MNDRVFWIPAWILSQLISLVINDRRRIAAFNLDSWEEDGNATLAFFCLIVWLSLEYCLARLILTL